MQNFQKTAKPNANFLLFGIFLIILTLPCASIEILNFVKSKFIENFNLLSIKTNIQNFLEAKLNHLGACNSTIIKLNYQLRQVCNESNLLDAALSNACINCFMQATANPLTTSLVSNLLPCAVTYLTGTEYNACITSLQNAINSGVSQVNAATQCPTGYCSFVQCIRQVNLNSLIQECYLLSQLTLDTSTLEGQTTHYKDTTACILANLRCSATNPVTGMPQRNYMTTTAVLFGKQITTTVQLYNALQISADNELRVISFPQTLRTSGYFCANSTSLSQRGYGDINCN